MDYLKRFMTMPITGILLLGVPSCTPNREPDQVIHREGHAPVTYVENDDPKMLEAREKARSSVAGFIEALNNPKPTQNKFSFKAQFSDGKHIEHMWLFHVRYEDGMLIGTVNNAPDLMTGIQLGDQKSVDPQQISDWMYVQDGKLVGGFSIRVIRERMSDSERQQLDGSVQFAIE